MPDDLVAKAKAQADGVAAAAPTSSGDFDVWIGLEKSPSLGPVYGPRPDKRVTQKASELQNAVLSMGASRDPAYNDITSLLIAGGFLKKDYAQYPTYASSSLGTALELHNAYVKTGGDKPFSDWLGWYASTQPEDTSGGGVGAYTGPVTTTSVTVTDETTAEALLNKFARDLLGRGLTQQETQKYIKQFRAAEMESPQVTTTEGSRGTRTSMTETAASKDELLRQIVSENPDYQKYQIDTTIMDLLLNDIKAGQEVIRG